MTKTAEFPAACGAGKNHDRAGAYRRGVVVAPLVLRLASLAACSGAPASGVYSAANPIKFGSAAYAPAPISETSEPSEAAAAASGEAPSPEPELQTKSIAIVQPGDDSAKPVKQSQSAVTPPDQAVASRHPKPEELVGLKPEEVKQILGSPALVRHDSPAQIWQYRSRDCVLDLFLYPPPAVGEAARAAKSAASEAAQTVVYFELRGRNSKQAAGDSCFNALVAAARAARSG